MSKHLSQIGQFYQKKTDNKVAFYEDLHKLHEELKGI